MRPRYVRRITASTGAYWCFKTRLHHLESENSSLVQAKEESDQHHHAQVVQKWHHYPKQEEIDQLTEKLGSVESQFKQLNTDATALADRYSRLEKAVLTLKIVFRKF